METDIFELCSVPGEVSSSCLTWLQLDSVLITLQVQHHHEAGDLHQGLTVPQGNAHIPNKSFYVYLFIFSNWRNWTLMLVLWEDPAPLGTLMIAGRYKIFLELNTFIFILLQNNTDVSKCNKQSKKKTSTYLQIWFYTVWL